MEVVYSARQKMLNASLCECLLNKPQPVVRSFARRFGHALLDGQPFQVDVSTAINMLIEASAADHGFEAGTMRLWLPGLRNEILLSLGTTYSSWDYVGPSQHYSAFWAKFYCTEQEKRSVISSLLKISAVDATRRLRFFSQGDVEPLSDQELSSGLSDGRVPLMVLDAHRLADRVRDVCGPSLFTVDAREAEFH